MGAKRTKPYTENISLRVSKETIDKLKQLATERRTSMTEVIVFLIERSDDVLASAWPPIKPTKK